MTQELVSTVTAVFNKDTEELRIHYIEGEFPGGTSIDEVFGSHESIIMTKYPNANIVIKTELV